MLLRLSVHHSRRGQPCTAASLVSPQPPCCSLTLQYVYGLVLMECIHVWFPVEMCIRYECLVVDYMVRRSDPISQNIRVSNVFNTLSPTDLLILRQESIRREYSTSYSFLSAHRVGHEAECGRRPQNTIPTVLRTSPNHRYCVASQSGE